MSQNASFPDQAYNTLVEEVYAPVFLNKLASAWGIVPSSDVERQQLLEQAGILRRVDDRERSKQASAGNTLIAEATDRLKIAVARRGYPQQPTTREQMIQKTAAEAVYSHPALAQAALEYGSYLASLGR